MSEIKTTIGENVERDLGLLSIEKLEENERNARSNGNTIVADVYRKEITNRQSESLDKAA